MEIKINFYAELEANTYKQIQFIREEFDYLFGHKMHFSAEDQKVAAGLINYLARIAIHPSAIQQLSKVLEDIESKYPNLV